MRDRLVKAVGVKQRVSEHAALALRMQRIEAGRALEQHDLADTERRSDAA